MTKMDIFQVLNPNRLIAFFQYSQGVKYIFQNNAVEACKAFAEAQRLHFRNPIYHAMHGIALVDLHSYEPGIKELLLSIELGVSSTKAASEVYGSLGYANHELKRYDEAIRYYEKSLEAFSALTKKITREMLYYNLGALYGIKKRFDKATDMYEKLIELEPDNAENHLLLGLACVECSQDDRAEKEIKKALKTNPSLREKYKDVDIDKILKQLEKQPS